MAVQWLEGPFQGEKAFKPQPADSECSERGKRVGKGAAWTVENTR